MKQATPSPRSCLAGGVSQQTKNKCVILINLGFVAAPPCCSLGLVMGSEERKVNKMPLFLDVHQHVPGATAKALADAHMKDLQVQGKYGVKYLKYWLDESKGKVFCLVEAPSKEAAQRVHRESHGLVADEIHEVLEGS